MDPLESSRTIADGGEGWLTAEQVAGILGIKRATVYAYVSRGQLHRKVALDGRTSLFDRRAVEALRLGRRPDRPGELRTILATAITRIAEDSVLIRGHDLIGAVRNGWGFLDVANIIWESTGADLADDDRPESELWPFSDTGATLDRLRIAVCVASSSDPLRSDLSPSTVRRTARRLINAMIAGVGPDGASPTEADQGDVSPASSLWTRLSPLDPTPQRVRCLDAAMALLADHGLAASTFAARIAASTRADPYSVVIAGLGALGGPLHGAASSGVHHVLADLAGDDDPLALISRSQRQWGHIPGFGHTVYRRVDPRYLVLHELVAETWRGDRRLDDFLTYRNTVARRTEAAPNIDLALGLLTYLADMVPEAGEVIFAVSRAAGWLGHALEEYDEKPLRLRPKGHYVGPGRRSSAQP